MTLLETFVDGEVEGLVADAFATWSVNYLATTFIFNEKLSYSVFIVFKAIQYLNLIDQFAVNQPLHRSANGLLYRHRGFLVINLFGKLAFWIMGGTCRTTTSPCPSSNWLMVAQEF